MLWSVLKVVIFIALVALAALGAGQLLELEGGVRIVMAGFEVNLTPIKSVIALILLMVLIWLLMKLSAMLVAAVRFVNGDETALSRHFDRSRQEKGFRALSEGLLALAAGEGAQAMAHAAKAERYLRKPALTNLISAQAAEVAGDDKKAEEIYKRLLGNDKTRFVGVRGLLRQKLAKGNTETALKLAQRAFALKPRNEEVQDTLLQLQAQAEDWAGARKTLDAKLRHGSLPRDLHRRRSAVLALSEARDVLDDDQSIEAREAAIEANRLSPDLVPAAALAARGLIEKGRKRHAARIIKKAWAVQPHPDLAAAFAAIQPEESPKARLRRFAPLIKQHPGDRETQLLEAELHITAEDFPAARRALGDLPDADPDARVLTMMAAVERGEGAPDAVVKGWLARAVTAPRGPAWVCAKCHHIHGEWAAVCENCGAFDTLSWQTPPASEAGSATGLGMLPLIVGAIEDRRDPSAGDSGATPTDVPEAEIVSGDAPGGTPEGAALAGDADAGTADATDDDGDKEARRIEQTRPASQEA